MYINLGNGKLVREKCIIGIFDLDKATFSKKTRDFLKKAEKNGKLINTVDEIPKSIILTDDKVYLSQLGEKTLLRRFELPAIKKL